MSVRGPILTKVVLICQIVIQIFFRINVTPSSSMLKGAFMTLWSEKHTFQVIVLSRKCISLPQGKKLNHKPVVIRKNDRRSTEHSLLRPILTIVVSWCPLVAEEKRSKGDSQVYKGMQKCCTFCILCLIF